MALEIALVLFILSAAVLFLVTEWMPMVVVAFLVLGSQPSIRVCLKKAVFELLWLNSNTQHNCYISQLSEGYKPM